MTLHRLADEGQHGFEWEPLLIDSSPPLLGYAHDLPQQVHPKTDQDKREGNVEQPQRLGFGRGADAGMILDTIAGLNAEMMR